LLDLAAAHVGGGAIGQDDLAFGVDDGDRKGGRRHDALSKIERAPQCFALFVFRRSHDSSPIPDLLIDAYVARGARGLWKMRSSGQFGVSSRIGRPVDWLGRVALLQLND